MKRNPRTVRNSGAYSSPGTPEHGPKSWSSERAIRSHVSGAALMPFNSGRALPSKWDDAERWITSPVSRHSSATAIPRRSGPLSPQNGNFMPLSPLTTGVLLPAGFSFRCDGRIYVNTSAVLGGTSSRDDILDGAKEEAPVSDGVEHSAATKKLINKGHCPPSFSALPSSGPTSLHQNGVADQVRDVQVDKGMTTAGHGQSEKQGVREMKDSSHVQDIPLPSQDSKHTSKFQRGEAKITAWENLQKAKAEAAIRKLEMKLEKKRSASMDRIMKKLRASEMKAGAMRNLLSENDPTRVGTTSSKYVKLHLHSNCFLCHRN